MKNKIALNKMKKGYFKLPHRIYSIKLSMGAISIFGYLARGSEEFNPSVGTISKALGISPTTAVKYLKELKDRNIIIVVQKGREKVITKYAFVPPNEWTEDAGSEAINFES